MKHYNIRDLPNNIDWPKFPKPIRDLPRNVNNIGWPKPGWPKVL